MYYESVEFQQAMQMMLNLLAEITDVHDYILAENTIKEEMHKNSPMRHEPINCAIWVRQDEVHANDYNPNSVAPPEMLLLETSIEEDGYTQPIVTWRHDGKYEIVDGFHRNRVGKECPQIKTRVNGYLPVTIINKEKSEKGNRMASTIRHNRARGKHSVDVMSEIVLELKNRNWTNKRIAKQLGMDEDEILRLCQITGLANLFSDDDFSKAWDIEKSSPDGIEFEQKDYILDDGLVSDGDEKTTTMNTSDENRIFHTYDKWECYRHNFYGTTVEGMTGAECEKEFADFFRKEGLFLKTARKVINEWVNSCEHYLTNPSMNRIAWLGQASVALHLQIPSKFSSGWFLLSKDEQDKNNEIALDAINAYLSNRGLNTLTMNQAMATGRNSVLY